MAGLIRKQSEHAWTPISNAYWVISGRLLAGGYPGAGHPASLAEDVGKLIEAGVTSLIDLTEAGEYGLPGYASLLGIGRSQANPRYARLAIPDHGAPLPDRVVSILDLIDTELAAGRTIYLHCYMGLGRTGMVVGCHLVRRGMDGLAALHEIQRLRQHLPTAREPSPETPSQRAMVRHWPVGG